MSYSDEHECHCEHPFYKDEKLNLCGSELCKYLTSKAYRNGKPALMVLREVEDNEET